MTPTVLKVLRPNVVNDDRSRRSMAKEGELLAGLQHPGLTRVFPSRRFRSDGSWPRHSISCTPRASSTSM